MGWTRGDHNGVIYEGNRRWGAWDKTKIPWVGHANWESLEKDKKTTWLNPHHVVRGGSQRLDDQGVYVDGKLRLHPGGVTSSLAYAARPDAAYTDFEASHMRDHVMDDLGRDPERYQALNSLLAAARGEVTLNAAELSDVVDEVAGLLGCDVSAGDAALASEALHAELPADVPEWVQIAETGTWKGHPGKNEINLTKQHLSSALQYFRRHYEDTDTDLVVDYEHSSVRRAYRGQPSPAAGWITSMELRNDGTELWARVEWTDKAQQAIAEREYRYLSPHFMWNVQDRVTGETVPLQIPTVGLTNMPFMTELESLNSQHGRAGGPVNAGTDEEKGGSDMELLNAIAEAAGKAPEQVASALGLDDGAEAEDEQVAEAVLSNAAEPREKVPEELCDALGVEEDAEMSAIKGRVITLQAQSGLGAVRSELGLEDDADEGEVVASIRELKEDKKATEAEELVNSAVQEGKIMPSQKEFYLNAAREDLDAAREAIASLPALTDGGVDTDEVPEEGEPLTDTQKAVCDQLGIDQEEYQAG